MQMRPDQPEGDLPLEEEGAKQGIGDPAYKISQQSTKAKNNVSQSKQNLTTSEHKDTYLGQRVHGVKVVSGQVSNHMILGELGKAHNSLVDIFFLYQIFRDASRIFQARVILELGEAVL
jgi:hypothetical protein